LPEIVKVPANPVSKNTTEKLQINLLDTLWFHLLKIEKEIVKINAKKTNK